MIGMSMKKVYTSKSEISIKVVLGSGSTVRVAFTPRTLGSSVYITDDEELQKAIEAHREYGKLFVCDERRSEAMDKAATPSQLSGQGAGVPGAGDGVPGTEEGAGAGFKVVNISSIQEAKDYLSDKFEISRSSLKNKDAVERAALEHGVVFEGLTSKK